ncbi:MAG TPA: rhodanese-related sulfurtransferase [Candidatus Nanoarchaeia archaeon]|nr:rhodanese-related sulfurtransferase [Candidatus Nanoarchaeia archaeon]
MKNTLFYKYVKIINPARLQSSLLKLSKSLNLRGKLLITEEGINGCVSGSAANITKFQKALTKDKRFQDMLFKDTGAATHTFDKMFVRVRKEIITSHFPSSMHDAAPYVEPKELKAWLDKKDNLLMVDARNDYESKIGKFHNALTPNLKTFRDWPNVVRQIPDKKQKIVTYCTGGIRCEKASAYLRKKGYKNVYQLHGGILQYGRECGNAYWEGKCFVFDQRGAVDIDPENQSKPITICIYCRSPCAKYHNCALESCDKRFIACPECAQQFDNCCSKKCRNKKSACYSPFARRTNQLSIFV